MSHWEVWFFQKVRERRLASGSAFLVFLGFDPQPSFSVFLCVGSLRPYGAQYLDPVRLHLNLITFLKIPLPDGVTITGSRSIGTWLGGCRATRETDSGVCLLLSCRHKASFHLVALVSSLYLWFPGCYLETVTFVEHTPEATDEPVNTVLCLGGLTCSFQNLFIDIFTRR